MTERDEKKTVCVYSSSSDAVEHKYLELASETGRLMGENNYDLVYGGGNVGLMGKLASAAQKAGSKVIGVIPEQLMGFNIEFSDSDELIITKTMHERKALMIKRADAFIALPGGFGTLEEWFEVVTQKQLGYHKKAIVLINAYGFYDKLLEFLKQIFSSKFAKLDYQKLYKVCMNPSESIKMLEEYEYEPIPRKWFKNLVENQKEIDEVKGSSVFDQRSCD